MFGSHSVIRSPDELSVANQMSTILYLRNGFESYELDSTCRRVQELEVHRDLKLIKRSSYVTSCEESRQH